MTADAAEKQMERARVLYDLRRYPEAEAALRRALAHDPARWDGHAWLVFALLAQSSSADPQPARLAEALREARAAVAARPDAALGYEALGWACLGLRKADDALRAAAEVLRINPQSAAGWQLSSAGWFQKQDYEKALRAADGGLRLEPEDVELLNNRAHALILLGRETEARGAVEAALALDPANDTAHTNLGWLALLQSRHADALGHFRAALRLDPLSEPARRGLLAALQARNPLYRQLVRYSLWAGRLTHAEALLFSFGLASVSSVLGAAARVFPPLYLVYLPWRVIYGIFAFFSWIADALFYLLLRFSPSGRLVLTRDEFAESNAFAACLIYLLGSFGLGLLFRRWGFWSGVLLGLGMMVPAAAVFALNPEAKARRAVLASLAVLMALTGLCGQGLVFLETPWALLPGVLFGLGWFSLPWIASLLMLWE